jgi:crotonobetainyl-CoA:carnitine CoA-transferase CaiB-like acyl-CoA transferase
MLLADLGMNVIKVETPGGMKNLSTVMRRRIDGTRRLERNKRSMTLNLRTDEGKEIFYGLAKKSDALLEGYRPGVAKRLGIDYETIKGINPRLVYCSMSGFGQESPYNDIPGFDMIYASIGGALSVVGDREGRPVQPLNYVGDMAGGGLHGALGIVSALYAREKTDRGQYIDLSITDGVVSVTAQALALYWYDGVLPELGKDFDSGGLPDYNIYEAKDRKHISIACLLPAFWENLCKTINREDLIPRQSDSGEKAEEVKDILQSIFLQKDRDEWFEILTQAAVPMAKVQTLDEVEKDPHVVHRQMVTTIKDPETGREENAVGIALKFSDTPGSLRSLAPEPGQHNKQILLELGYTEDQVEEMRNKGVIT